MTTDRLILLVDDNEDDVFLMERAVKGAGIKNPVHVVSDGEEAINYLSGAGQYSDRELFPFPAVVFLDLKLPFKSGHEVLQWIREQPKLKTLVVVVLTSSNQPSDIRRCYALGANSYLVKPPTPEQLVELAKSFRWYWLEYNHFDETRPQKVA
jgi:CheY-like chemotaxis protein